jgi:predicted nucleic acid-binding protein
LKGWLLDTNVVAALINPRGAPSVKAWAAAQDEELFHISVLTLAEYDKGIHNLPHDHVDRARYIGARDALEERFADRVLSLTDGIVRRWGRLAGEVKRSSGHPPPVIDTMLAATAIEHDLYLVTRNVKDARPSGAPVFDPWNDDPGHILLGRRHR